MPRWPLLALALLLLSPSGASGRRKRPATEGGRAGAGARPGRGDGEAARGERRGDRVERPERPARVEPPACADAGCEPGVKVTLEEDGAPPRPVPAFRYRVRVGDQRLDGSCPRAKDEGPPVVRCLQGGLLVPYVPEQLDVAIEAAGLRPLLQTLSPQYETRGGCCQRAELRLLLRRERPAE